MLTVYESVTGQVEGKKNKYVLTLNSRKVILAMMAIVEGGACT